MAAEEMARDDDWRDVLRGWQAEWRAMGTEHAFWKADPEITAVAFENGGIVVTRGNSAHEVEIAHLPEAQGLAAAVARADASSFGRDVVVRLPETAILRANVWLPKARASTLRQALHFELERLSPVSPGELYFDFAEAARDKTANRVELSLRIVRRDIVDDAVRTCRGAGLSVSGVTISGDRRPADWREFPVDRPAHLRFLWRKWNLAFLGGLALFLALAAMLAWYERNAAAQDMLADQILLEQRHAAIVHRMEDDIARTSARIGFLARQKLAPMTVSVLAELARILPDGTWLDEVEIGSGRVHIRGFSHAAADLIGVLDSSRVFANAQFGAPLVRNPAGNVEQFDIVADLRGAGK
ncbi:MAG TPA: PilN domain-containing protein [Rhizomicrobium sp.]|nr:PilN domain-containing protein [Rhizomicrobium sp.]